MTDVSINFTGLNTQKLQTWILALRAPFFTASIVPLLLGMAIAFYETKIFDLGLGLLTLISGIAIQAGTNLANDYYDQSTDGINANFTQFNGGSRMIQNDIISPRAILTAAIISFIVGIVTAIIILINTQGWFLLIFL
ncbi:MAG: prenyltransferase, partial [Candidatus Hodarchaeales archaeon]